MYKWFIILLIVADVSISSCGRYAAHKYHLGKSFSFENKNEFLKYAKKQTGFDENHIYYADRDGYFSMMNELQKLKREGVLWGFYAGNQTYVKMEPQELEKLYCKQRIQNLSSAFFINGKLPEPYLTDSTIIQSFKLKKLSDNSPLLWSNFSNKRMIILQFATAYGSYYNDLFNNIASPGFDASKSGNVIIICLDPVFQLP